MQEQEEKIDFKTVDLQVEKHVTTEGLEKDDYKVFLANANHIDPDVSIVLKATDAAIFALYPIGKRFTMKIMPDEQSKLR